MTFPATRGSLIARVGAEDEEAFREFFARYAGPSLGFLRLLGVDRADAEDVLQEVMTHLPRLARRFESGRGRFHRLLMATLRERWIDARRAAHRQKRGSGKVVSGDAPASVQGSDSPTLLECLAAPADDAAEWEERLRALEPLLEEVLNQRCDAARRRAYLDWLLNHEEHSSEEIARRHGLNVNKLVHLRRIVAEVLRRRAERIGIL